MDSSAPLYSIRTVWPESVEVAEERRGRVVKGRSRGSASVQERLTDSGAGGRERVSSLCSSDMVGKAGLA